MAARKETTKKTASKPASKKTVRKSATRTTAGAGKTATPARKSAGKTTGKTASRSTSKSASKSTSGKTPTAAEQLAEYQRKRDFEKTAEPSGASARKPSRASASDKLAFVIQKHAATQLHYDLRLEIDGVMKSWAVPKGPSADPGVKRLAMQVEDHPVEYNTFEGTIPAGEYGGGTVMLWDHGTYEIENALDNDMNSAAHDQYERGDLKIDFHGKRIKGSYALVRTRGFGRSASKPSWLLIKHRDSEAHPETATSSLTGKYVKSVTTDRTMDEIAEGARVWHSSH